MKKKLFCIIAFAFTLMGSFVFTGCFGESGHDHVLGDRYEALMGGQHRHFCNVSGCTYYVYEQCDFGNENTCVCGSISAKNFNVQQIDNDTCLVYGINEIEDTKIVIPSKIYNQKVVGIGHSAFTDLKTITSITIPDTVTFIEDYAFSGTSLTSITIPSSVTSLGGKAFYGCTSLESVTILGNIKTIGDYTFAGCTSLKTVELPSSVTSMGNRVFENCTDLKSITIPKNVVTVGVSLFEGCSSLKTLKILSSLVQLQEGWFSYSPWTPVENLYLNTKIIDDDLMGEYRNVKHITLLSDVKTINNSSNLGYNLSYCEDVSVDENNLYFASQDGILYNKEKTELIMVPTKIKGKITIPSGVQKVPSYIFQSRNQLEEIVLPEGLWGIGLQAFMNCTSLKKVTFPTTIVSIDDNAFWGCTSLEEVNISTNARFSNINKGVFMGCTSLKSVTIATQFNDSGIIYADAFRGCTALQSVTLPQISEIKSDAFKDCSALTVIKVKQTEQAWNDITKVDGWDNGTGNYTVEFLATTED